MRTATGARRPPQVPEWLAEMASLGAAGQLARRAGQQLAEFGDRQYTQAAAQARTAAAARALAATALVLTVTVAARDGASVSTLVFLALLAVGVLGSAERLGAAAEARALGCYASERLGTTGYEDSAGPGRPYRPVQGSAFLAGYGLEGLTVSGYALPGTPAWARCQIGFRVSPGQTLFVTGASGTGKSTLLGAISAALRHESGVAAAVLADDYLFAGTIAANVRLANPAATDDEIQDLLTDMLLDRSGLSASTITGPGGPELSGGEQRRLQVARALAAAPDVLLVDEPTTGLDSATATEVLAAIRRRLPCGPRPDHARAPDLPGRPRPAWAAVPLD